MWLRTVNVTWCVCRCEYLLQEKGQEFVHQIQARFPRLFEQVGRVSVRQSNLCVSLRLTDHISLLPPHQLLTNDDNTSREFVDPPGEFRDVVSVGGATVDALKFSISPRHLSVSLVSVPLRHAASSDKCSYGSMTVSFKITKLQLCYSDHISSWTRFDQYFWYRKGRAALDWTPSQWQQLNSIAIWAIITLLMVWT